ncbi:MAG: nitrogenase component 1 [Sphaerochaeta sp.]
MRDLHNITDEKVKYKLIRDTECNNLFYAGLQYNPPARGTWSIVHTGILLPECHEIFVCAEGCLRGTVLSAHEGGFADHFSTVAVQEENITNGDLESQIIEGCADVINRLDYRPKAVEVFTSCLHSFSGCDFQYCIRELSKRFTDINFQDCYMIPTMRNSGITPDEKMREQLYAFLNKQKVEDRAVSVLGNAFCLEESSDLRQIVKASDYIYRDITICDTFYEFQEMGKSEILIYNLPAARQGAELLAKRFDKKLYYSPLCYRFDEIKENNKKLEEIFGTSIDTYDIETKIKKQLLELKDLLNGWSISIDYTATYRAFNLARLFEENGIDVNTLYVESVADDDKEDYEWLKENKLNLKLISPSHPGSIFIHKEGSGNDNVLAIGQKAAFFEGTDHFVNLIEGSGYQGFDGLSHLLSDVSDAFYNVKDTKSIISVKAWGCYCDK